MFILDRDTGPGTMQRLGKMQVQVVTKPSGFSHVFGFCEPGLIEASVYGY